MLNPRSLAAFCFLLSAIGLTPSCSGDNPDQTPGPETGGSVGASGGSAGESCGTSNYLGSVPDVAQWCGQKHTWNRACGHLAIFYNDTDSGILLVLDETSGEVVYVSPVGVATICEEGELPCEELFRSFPYSEPLWPLLDDSEYCQLGAGGMGGAGGAD